MASVAPNHDRALTNAFDLEIKGVHPVWGQKPWTLWRFCHLGLAQTSENDGVMEEGENAPVHE